MKIIFLTLALCIAACAPAQVSGRIFSSQLMVVFSDMKNHFEYLRGDLIDSRDGDSLFASNTALEGTVDNSIFISAGGNAYQAMINDSTSREGARLVMNAWKEKLLNLLDTSFRRPPGVYESTAEPLAGGFEFVSDKIRVMLIRHQHEEGWYWVNLVITPK